MNKVWQEPQVMVQPFVANEYVAACGDQYKTYLFECNAPGGWLTYYSQHDNAVDGQHVDDGSDYTFFRTYSPCNEKHETGDIDDFYDGYVTDRRGNETPVIVWLEYVFFRGERHFNDAHATTKLNMNAWETGKS